MNPLNLFSSTTDVDKYQSGDTIFKEGEPGDRLYVVRRGKVELSVHGKPLETVEEGDIIGELSLIDRFARSATAIARSSCELIPVDEQRFRNLVSENPFFALHVMEVMAERLRRTTSLATK